MDKMLKFEKKRQKKQQFFISLQKTPDFPEIAIGSLNAVIGAHTSPGLPAVFCYCGERKPM